MPNRVETVMKLNPADAERLGGVPLDAPPEVETLDDTPVTLPAPVAKARRGAANKARTASPNKAGRAGGD
jgi:hypothetical protein